MNERFIPRTVAQLHPDVWRAKREAVSRFLPRATNPTGRRYGYSASPAHEHNVLGIGVGRKVKGGKGTHNYAVRIYVRRKLPRSQLGSYCVQETIQGVPTDVVEIAPFRALQDVCRLARQRTRPICAGTSIGFVDEDTHVAGTITAVVRRDSANFILSNNHVLAYENRLALGTAIVQPATVDAGRDPADRVGTLEQFVPLTEGDNAVDVALARLPSDSTIARCFATGAQLTSTKALAARVGQRVAKVGRGTGYTEGVVQDLSITAQVDFETGQYTFVDQLLIASNRTPFSDVGDSGSMIMSAGQVKRPVAMLFAGQPDFALATPIDRVLSTLGVQIVT